jgi:hypothetical protein
LRINNGLQAAQEIDARFGGNALDHLVGKAVKDTHDVLRQFFIKPAGKLGSKCGIQLGGAWSCRGDGDFPRRDLVFGDDIGEQGNVVFRGNRGGRWSVGMTRDKDAAAAHQLIGFVERAIAHVVWAASMFSGA